MADLFGVGVPAVSKHLKNIFETECEAFRQRQDLEYRSDFDEEVRRLQGHEAS
jgi:hypothetical protein